MKKFAASKKWKALFLFVVGMLFIWTTAAAVHITKLQDRSIQVVYVPNPDPADPNYPNYFIQTYNINFALEADLNEEVYQADSVTVESQITSFNQPKYTFNFTEAAKIFIQNGIIVKEPVERKFLFSVPLTVKINNTNNDIEFTSTPNGVILTANWTQLPLNVEFTARSSGRFKTLNIDGAFNEKETMVFSVNSQGPGAAPSPVGDISGGVELDGSGRLFLTQCNETVAANIAPGQFRATMCGTGPVIIYQSGNNIFFSLYSMVQVFDPPNPVRWECTRVAGGSVCGPIFMFPYEYIFLQ